MEQNKLLYYKNRLGDYVETITELSSGSRSLYICPLCGSGSKEKHTGAFSVKDDHWKCFSCGRNGDIFDLIAAVNEVEVNSREVFDIADDLYLEDYNENCEIEAENKNEVEPTLTKSQLAAIDNSEYIAQCSTSIKSCPEALDYLMKTRGFSEDTISRFKIGYDSDFTFINTKGSQSTLGKSIIIPYPNENYYIARLLEPPDWYSGKYKKVTGLPEPLFNMEALLSKEIGPIFVTEGQFDALSVIEAGADAIATNGIAGKAKLIQHLKTNPTEKTLIISYDTDSQGEEASLTLQKDLDSIGINFLVQNISGKYNDPNEAFVNDKDRFFHTVRNAVASAREQIVERQVVDQDQLDGYIRQFCVTAYLDSFLHDIKNRKYTKGIPTGYKRLDKTLDGGLYPGLYIIGAISSLGKTTFCLQAADEIAANGSDVLSFSLEMAKKELVAKSLSRLSYHRGKNDNSDTGLTTRQILNANFNKEDETTIQKSIEKYKSFSDRLFITEGLGNITTNTIRTTIEKHIVLTGNRPVVLVDYIQIIEPSKQNMSDKQIVDRATHDLKCISRDFDIPVVVISSLNRSNYTKDINMAAFKESGILEYSSDVLIGLQFADMEKNSDDTENYINNMKNEYRRKIELKVLKNRNGVSGSIINYDYIAAYNLFEEYP